MSASRQSFKKEQIHILITTDYYVLKSTLKDLPTDLLERLANEASIELLERDDDFQDFLEDTSNDKDDLEC